jgi:hypothetical protein
MTESFPRSNKLNALFPEVDELFLLKRQINIAETRHQKKSYQKQINEILNTIVREKDQVKLSYLYQMHLIPKAKYVELDRIANQK